MTSESGTAHTWEKLRAAFENLPYDVVVVTLPVCLEACSERARQIDKGFDDLHDDKHTSGEIAQAAATYALATSSVRAPIRPSDLWPWEDNSFKPRGRRENLIRAIALLLAEVERLDRVEVRKVADHG